MPRSKNVTAPVIRRTRDTAAGQHVKRTRAKSAKQCEHPADQRSIETETNEVLCLSCGALRDWLPWDAWEARQARIAGTPVTTGEE